MLREWIIVLLGGQIKGFKDVDEAIEHIRNTDDVTRKYQILTLATKKLFNTISSDDILKQIHGIYLKHASRRCRTYRLRVAEFRANALNLASLRKRNLAGVNP